MELASVLAILVAVLANPAAAEGFRMTFPPIPITHVGCFGDHLDEKDKQMAKDRLLRWGDAGNQVPAKGLHTETQNSVTWYLCNCKYAWRDGIPKVELDYAEYRIKRRCGENQSGWAYSFIWDKSYNLAATDSINWEHQIEMCPWRCLGVEYWH